MLSHKKEINQDSEADAYLTSEVTNHIARDMFALNRKCLVSLSGKKTTPWEKKSSDNRARLGNWRAAISNRDLEN